MRADGPTREEIRHAAAEVFTRGEFRRRKTLLDRVIDWIRAHLPHTNPPRVSTGGSSGLGSLVLYLIGVAVVALLLWIIVRVIRTRVGRRRVTAEIDPEPEIEEERSTAAWRADAERAEAEGRWKEAIRYRYRELVTRLVEIGAVEPIVGRTTGELRVDMDRSSPGVSASFGEASSLFELPWYADRPTGARENARMRELVAVVTAGACRLDDAPVTDDDTVVVPA